jgi:hypothetical protein
MTAIRGTAAAVTGAASGIGRALEALAKTTPQAAALRIFAGIEKNQPRILIGNDARFMDLLQRLRPATYWAPIARRIEKMGNVGKNGV